MKPAADTYAAIDTENSAQVMAALASYLSLAHVQQPELGCPLSSLTAEVARANSAAKDAFQFGVQQIQSTVEKLTGSAKSAWTLMAQNVGVVMIARALTSEPM